MSGIRSAVESTFKDICEAAGIDAKVSLESYQELPCIELHCDRGTAHKAINLMAQLSTSSVSVLGFTHWIIFKVEGCTFIPPWRAIREANLTSTLLDSPEASYCTARKQQRIIPIIRLTPRRGRIYRGLKAQSCLKKLYSES